MYRCIRALSLSLFALGITLSGMPAHAAPAPLDLGSSSTGLRLGGNVPKSDKARTFVVHAAPSGRGKECTATRPCSLDVAIVAGRAAMARLNANVTVVLHGGTYYRSRPIVLGTNDAGVNGKRMTWTAGSDGRPVIDGAMRPSSWSAWKGRKGVHRAKVPAGTRSRQLFVNGKAATRASASTSTVLGKISKSRDGRSFRTSPQKLASWMNLTDTELVWAGGKDYNVAWQSWSQSRCPLEGAASRAVRVARPCYTAADPYGLQGVNVPSVIENNLALLTKPGQFYLDSVRGWIYYMPRRGENLSKSKVELPVAQGLVRGDGVKDLTIRGVSFQNDTWTEPSTKVGYPAHQGGWYQKGGNLYSPPGAVQFKNSQGIRLESVSVLRAGASGIEFRDGTRDSYIRRARVEYTAASGVVLGGVLNDQRNDTRLEVSDSAILNSGRQYLGAVGLFGGYVSNAVIRHNEVGFAAYSGISFGWGWGQKSSFANNRIEGNHVHDVMKSVLSDGGGIYVNGVGQGRNTITGNLVEGTFKPYGAIYLDGSASNWDVTGNVVRKTNTNWILVQDLKEQMALRNTVRGNWTDTGRHVVARHPSNKFLGNAVVSKEKWPAAAQKVVTNAG